MLLGANGQPIGTGAPVLVGLSRKADVREDLVIQAAMDAARGCDQEPLPVMWRGRCLGWVLSDPSWAATHQVHFWPGRARPSFWCGFSSYDDLVTEMTSYGKRWTATYQKNHGSASVANNWFDLWPVAGYPAAGTYAGAAFTAVQFDATVAGGIDNGGSESTDTKHLIGLSGSVVSNTGTLMLYDRVLTYEACTLNANANQAMTNSLTIQRYNGNTDGGLKIITTCQTTLGSTASNMTQLQYTDDAGNATQTMPQSPVPAIAVSVNAPSTSLGARVVSPITAAATISWGPFMPLLAGDLGVQLIKNFTTSAANSGSLCFILGRPLAILPIVNPGYMHMIDCVQQTMNLVKIWDGAYLSMMFHATSSSVGNVLGHVDMAWG